MITRVVLLRKVLPTAAVIAAVCCYTCAALVSTPRAPSVVSSWEADAPEEGIGILSLWTSSLEVRRLEEEEEEEEVRRLEEEGEVRRALTTVGVPGEALLLAVANSDEDAVDEFGHEHSSSPNWHKDLLPMNRYSTLSVLAHLQDDMPP